MLTAALRLAMSVFTVILSTGPTARCSNCQLQYLSLSVDFILFFLLKESLSDFVESTDVAANGVKERRNHLDNWKRHKTCRQWGWGRG